MKKNRNCTDCPLRKCQEQCVQEKREFTNSIAKAVYEARSIINMSQAEFAAAIGITSHAGQTIISFWENGIGNRKPNPQQALEMSKLSGFPIERFIYKTDDTVLDNTIPQNASA